MLSELNLYKIFVVIFVRINGKNNESDACNKLEEKFTKFLRLMVQNGENCMFLRFFSEKLFLAYSLCTFRTSPNFRLHAKIMTSS